MSARGVFAVDRGIWDDPDFADEAFSEREAFLWLVGEAAWRPKKVRVASAVIELARGQCAFSTRFMAAKWKWSEARVRRYLGRLKKAAMIDTATDAAATRITICKYDRFQRVSLPTDAPSDAPPTQERRKEEDREGTEDISDPSGSADEPGGGQADEADSPSLRRSLLTDGLRTFRAITGRSDHSGRAGIGHLLGKAHDDAGVLLALIEEAAEREVADPVTWITRQLRIRDEQGDPVAPTRIRGRDPPPTGQTARLVELHRRMTGRPQDGTGADDHDRLDAGAPADGEPPGDRGEGRGVAWVAGAGGRPSEPLLRAAERGAYGRRPSAACRAGGEA